MVTSALFYHVLHLFNVTIHIRDVCVFLAPFFSSLTVLVTYHLTKELKVSLNYLSLVVSNAGISVSRDFGVMQ
jgi:asparagine N-glycosylation enzyme membrane subunit Stt3